ncbi:alpha/beta fold hydrolase [Microbacterium sp.]|uniref:alpha/beta fold hydrolase n=1 Tax=Microbacterium sp. TaxID=51671 RepID=UPI003A85426D
MPTVTSHGVPIAWHETGPADGSPVLLVHGFGSNRAENWGSAGWEKVLSEAGFRAILVDLRGHGDSGRPEGADHYTADLFIADLVAVLDALGLDRVDYLGYSFGARLGWDLALAHPERVRRLALGGFSLGSPMTDFDITAARAFIAEGTEISHPLTAALMRMASLVPGNDLPRLVDLVEGVRGTELPPATEGPIPEAPTMIVVGERDAVAVGAGDLAADIGADYVELPARSHASAITARRFKEAVIEWLGH